MSLVAKLKRPGPNGFGYGSTAEDVTRGLDLSGRTILITGCNSGIGQESFRVLAARGAHIIAAARTVEKAERAAAEVGARDQATPVACELSDPESVEACARTLAGVGRPIDVLMLNAGIMALPKVQTTHGLELQFFTNHIGHALLTDRLMGLLSDEARVVVLSSTAHQRTPKGGIDFQNLDGSRGYDAWKFYGQSKLANLLYARELARRLEGTGKTVNAVHPGVIKTGLARHLNPFAAGLFAAFSPLLLKSVPQGAATQCYVAVHPEAAEISGAYFADCNPAESSAHGRDPVLARQLWDETERILNRVTGGGG